MTSEGELRAPRIVVVGSLNADLSVWVPRRPATDETLHADRVAWFRGGKGANQAVAAARLGARVAMVGRVGNDEHGSWLRTGLEVEGIDCGHVSAADAPSGLAIITIDPADVSIVVAAGANACLDVDGVRDAADAIAAADALLVQGEVGAAPTRVAAQIAREHDTLVVFNPAPFNDVAPAVLPLCDVVIVNRTEAAQLAALRSRMSSQPADGSAGESGALLRADALLVETRGAAGCEVRTSLRGAPQNQAVPAPQVAVRDATGAGDAFAAAFAVGMASDLTPVAAAELAVRAGAAAVTVDGAQPSLPTLTELQQLGGSTSAVAQDSP